MLNDFTAVTSPLSTANTLSIQTGAPWPTSVKNAVLISVVIPCYNHASYLGEAIESVLAQTHSPVEIIVVDDGSIDQTAEVTARYPGVQYIRQENQGLSAARNTGLRHSQGDYVVFLDADDRLLSRALEIGRLCLEAHPECAFVSGHYRYVNADGSLLVQHPQNRVRRDHYLALLRGNYIGMHATVMYRRTIFDQVGVYDPSLRACEDYDLYLRIARTYPVFCHDEVVAEYRQHGGNMSGNPTLMLHHVLGVLGTQRPFLQDHPERQRAFQQGVRAWQAYYGRVFFAQAAQARAAGQQGRSAKTLWAAARQVPLYTAYHSAKWLFDQGYGLAYRLVPPAGRALVAQALYRFSAPPVGRVNMGSLRSLRPDPQTRAEATALPIHEQYSATFLADQAHYVRGQVLEIGDRPYAELLGGERVVALTRLPLGEIPADDKLVDDLACVAHLPDESFDCILFVQVLQRVYELESAVKTLHRLLKPGGVLLATAPGIGLVKENPGDEAGYWAFTERTLQSLFGPCFPGEQLHIAAHGNVLASIAWLHGLPANALQPQEREHCDPQYPLLLTVKALKCGSRC